MIFLDPRALFCIWWESIMYLLFFFFFFWILWFCEKYYFIDIETRGVQKTALTTWPHLNRLLNVVIAPPTMVEVQKLGVVLFLENRTSPHLIILYHFYFIYLINLFQLKKPFLQLKSHRPILNQPKTIEKKKKILGQVQTSPNWE